MSAFFEIAYATASNRLCLFTGTGFSKAVTENKAPSWQGLLEEICKLLPNPKEIKDVLFPESGKNPLSLEESAQVLAIELSKQGLNLHEEIAKIISPLRTAGNNAVISDFLAKNTTRIVTTNYDKLAEELSGDGNSLSISPGFPVPRSQAQVKVYHVHGSIDSPTNMVVTSNDYFRFINGESYFSRKLSTVLHENTVVILGYSLGDTNLKAIINDYKGFSRNQVIGANLFLVSRNKIDQHVKDYYAHCYGIRVLDNLTVHDFFHGVNGSLPEAKDRTKLALAEIKSVIFKNYSYTDDYLKIESSFYEIIGSVAAIGRSINDPLVVTALGKILEKKIKFTQANGAWGQYEHLARWLIYLGTILELAGTSIENIFLDATLRSMTSMSKKLYYGYSWHAYNSWSNRWFEIISSNREIIKKYIEAKAHYDDALEIVRRG